LSKVEVLRACRRSNETILPDARHLLASIELIPLEPSLLDRATEVGPPLLRSLDAIHLVSGLSLGSDLTAFVAYDRRLQAAAEAERLPVVAPA